MKARKFSKSLQCPQCLKFLTSEAHFRNHLATHRPKNFICDICGRHFNSKDKLRLHLFNHRVYYRIKCIVCEKEYKTNQSMRKHLRTHWEAFQCSECGELVELLSQKCFVICNLHEQLNLKYILGIQFLLNVHHFICFLLGQTFKHKRLLQNHISSLHRFDQSIPCNCKWCDNF